MFQKISKAKRYFVESLTFSFGIYFGMLFSYVIQQVVETYRVSLVLTEHSHTFGIGDLTFVDVINECSALSNQVLVLSVVGVMVLFALLFTILYDVDEMSWADEAEMLVLIVSLSTWFIAPIAIISTSIRNPLLYIGLDVDISTSELATLSENYRYLDQFWYFGNSFIYEMKVLFSSVSILISSTFIKSKKLSGKKTANKKLALVVLIPIVLYGFLEVLLPTVYGTFYSVGQIGIGFGGTGEVGGRTPIEPFFTLSPVMLVVSYVLVLIQLYNLKKPKKRKKHS